MFYLTGAGLKGIRQSVPGIERVIGEGEAGGCGGGAAMACTVCRGPEAENEGKSNQVH